MKAGKPFAYLDSVISDMSFQTWGGHLWPDVETGLAFW
jgi:hypothetical protein